MRTILLFTLACISSLMSCSNHSTEEFVVDANKPFPLQFNIQMEREVTTFPTTRSIPDTTIPEPTVSNPDSSEPELYELCDKIEYLVYKVDNETSTLYKHKHFTPDDIDFGFVYDSLPQGNYQFYFVAHSSETATLAGSTLSFDKVSDTFCGSATLQITAAGEINKDITLERIVSRIEFMATDIVPKEINRFDMVVSGIVDQLDFTQRTGVPTANNYTFSHIFTPEEIELSNTTHSFYTFLPSADEKLSAHLTAIGEGEKVLRERNVTSIIPEKNKIIRYKGRLYTPSESDDTFSLNVFDNGAWEETKEEELTDD